MEKKCKVIMLATDKKSSLLLTRNNKLHSTILDSPNVEYLKGTVFQHLHILSDDEINDNDWYYYKNGELEGITQCINGSLAKTMICRKIISTNDRSLQIEINKPSKLSSKMYKSISSISQSFIDKYVSEYNKGNKIEEVMVEYVVWNDIGRVYVDTADETRKQYYKLYINPDNTINIKTVKDSWNREEVKQLCWEAFVAHKCINGKITINDANTSIPDFNKWIETNL